MARRPGRQRPLSAKEALIIAALRREARPLSAYDLIELLHDDGVASPPTVYRALKRLIELGLAHRIESLNAFVACSDACLDAGGDHGNPGMAAFAICSGCGAVAEFHQTTLASLLEEWAKGRAFLIHKATIELCGRCHDCAAASPTSER